MCTGVGIIRLWVLEEPNPLFTQDVAPTPRGTAAVINVKAWTPSRSKRRLSVLLPPRPNSYRYASLLVIPEACSYPTARSRIAHASIAAFARPPWRFWPPPPVITELEFGSQKTNHSEPS